MKSNFKLLTQKLKYLVKDFPILHIRSWLPYIHTYVKFGYHKNHIRHQPISKIRRDRFIQNLSLGVGNSEKIFMLDKCVGERKLPQRVLITNSTIGGRSGTEVWIYEIYNWLSSKDIDVLVFAPNLNHKNPKTLSLLPYTSSIREASKFKPDLIHLQHAGHHKISELLECFESIPVFNLLHGISDQIELPLHPKNLKFLHGGVSRLICSKGAFLTKQKTLLLKNFTDREATINPPKTPLVAAIVSTKTTSKSIKRVQEIFSSHKSTVKVFGHDSASFIWDYDAPETALTNCDIALCSGKTVIDLLGLGLNVMLYEDDLLGPVVTEKNYNFLSDMNFALASETVPAVNVFSSNSEIWLETQLRELSQIDPVTLTKLRNQENNIEVVGTQLLRAYSELMRQR